MERSLFRSARNSNGAARSLLSIRYSLLATRESLVIGTKP